LFSKLNTKWNKSYQERKGHAAVNANKNRWFKFNDTTVEEIVMTDETLEAECFGGKFKVSNFYYNSTGMGHKEAVWCTKLPW
jgi:hypothetical protein